MANTNDTAEALFYLGKMNKDFDERFISNGEYIDALNVRVRSTELGSTSNSDLGSMGALENSKGNTKLTNIKHVSSDAKCIGVFEDGSNETIYWFVTSSSADLILSYNTNDNTTVYHVVSDTVLNFSSENLINGINKLDDLLFWTDNLNPPRKINVTRSYPVNGISESDISVIVAPPLNAPSIVLYNTPGEKNYMLKKFISFSYRYKYLDGEYSALSQFSDIAFEPGEFEIDYAKFNNVGMSNSFNSVKIDFNTGPKNVIGIDICFKLSDSNIINVIEKFDKVKEEWLDNKTETLVFTNRKIYTTLPGTELLRLYDNVPLEAKSQTTIGNRIMYGNYVDGYDVEDIDYSLEVVSTSITDNTLPVTYTGGILYTIDSAVSKLVNQSTLNIDFTGKELKKGYVITIDFDIVNDSVSGSSAFAPGPGSLNNFNYTFSFLLQKDYTSTYQLATSQEFVDAVSTHLAYASSSQGVSLTDIYNSDKVAKPADIDTGYGEWADIDSGITAVGGAFLISAVTGSNVISIQCPAVKFSTEFPAGTVLYGYQYFRNASTSVYFSKLGAKKSLHSNRDYEVAVVYMDDYLRSSTALVDTYNTIFVGAENSGAINNIRVTLRSAPPSWATKYKFVLKQSVAAYETIYTNLFFKDDLGNTWFKLDGDNRQKIKDNDVLIVKKDTVGIVSGLVETTVLETKTQSEDFIIGNKNASDEDIIEPAGLYMRLRPSGFTADYDPNSFRDNGSLTDKHRQAYYLDEPNPNYDSAVAVSATNRAYRPFAVPAASQIKFEIHAKRDGSGGSCDDYEYTYEKTFMSSKDYDNMYLWFNGDGADLTTGEYRPGGEAPPDQVQDPLLRAWTNGTTGDYGNWVSEYFFQAENGVAGGSSIDGDQGRLKFTATTGIPSCRLGGINPKYSRITVRIIVQTGSGALIFETEPAPSNGEIYFENSQSFDIVDGYHMSGGSANDQNQSSIQDAVIDLNFFNCFAFGNGVESYKINDSLVGVGFYLGSRVTAVSQEDYKRSHRYASITYSGVYNAETNINKLNEFNLALANWKDCEKAFGPINVMHARKTDILVLQEDRISNVLVNKNVITDSIGGGVVTSIPEVLGTQVARSEEFGISSNAESFATYGYDSYFTDTKRNAVINLKGEELINISDLGMSSWFREKFKDRINYQNIGGYDPYMKEYVLSMNGNELPTTPTVYGCGITLSQENTSTPYTFNIELGGVIGEVLIDYEFFSGTSSIVVVYKGVNVVSQNISGTGSVSFNKNSVEPTIIQVTLVPVLATYEILVNCPLSDEITVVRVVVNSVDYAGQTIHNNYNWSLGTHTSTYNTDFVILEQDKISLYDSDTAYASFGVMPAFGSTIKMSSNKASDDTFVFNYNSFKYLVSDTLYTEAQIASLRTQLIRATPTLNTSPGNYEASFVYNNPDAKQYLYLVWDYTNHTEVELCYDETSIYDACVACSDIEPPIIIPPATCYTFKSAPYEEFFSITYIDCDGVQQTDSDYCTSTICRYEVCARSIVSSTETMTNLGICIP